MRYRVRPSNLFRDTWIVVIEEHGVVAQFDSLFDAKRVAKELNGLWIKGAPERPDMLTEVTKPSWIT